MWHTHGFVHEALFKAYKHLGYNVSWFPDTDESRKRVLINELSTRVTSGDDSSKPTLLIISEGNQCKHIPVIFYASYLLHNAPATKIKLRQALCKNVFDLQVLTTSHLRKIAHRRVKGAETEHGFQHSSDMLIMCWATDLLPHEIEAQMQRLEKEQQQEEEAAAAIVNMVGMPTHVWTEDMVDWCKSRGITLNFYGGFSDRRVPSGPEHVRLIQQSIVAPALQERRQVRVGYIPCRLFKNISYGKLGISNNPHVLEVFPQDLGIVVEKTVPALLDRAMALCGTSDMIRRQMQFVKDNHTYVNRIRLIEAFIKSNHR